MHFCKKEYLIKRILVNEADVNYKSWTLKDKYSDKELQQIGQATVNLIEVTKRLPTIIEQDFNLYNLNEVVKLVYKAINDDPWIKRATKKYLGQIIEEDYQKAEKLR